MKKILLILCLICTVTVGYAYDFTVNGVGYNIISKSECEVASAKESSDYTIPSEVAYNGLVLSVTSIGNNAFSYNWYLKSVSLPSTITKIGNEAFRDCVGLTTIDLPDNITYIGQKAFYNCPIKNVVLPSALETVEAEAFISLRRINIPKKVNSIKYNSFGDSLETITVDSDNSVYDSREDCNAIVLSDSDKIILGAMHSHIPNGIGILGEYSFYRRQIDNVTLPNSIKVIGNNAFAESGLNKITLSQNLKIIGDGAFRSTFISNITLPDSLIKIGMYAFQSCSMLSNITIPSNTQLVGYYAFAYCPELQTISITSSSTRLESEIAPYCECLRIIKMECDTPPNATETTFDRTESGFVMKNLVVPVGAKDNYSIVSPWDKFWNIVENGENISYMVGDVVVVDSIKYAITSSESCDVHGLIPGTKNVYIPAKLNNNGQYYTININNGVFSGVESIRSFIAPELIRTEYSQGNGICYNCPNLEYVECDNLEYLSGGSGTATYYCAFADCPSLKTIKMPKLETIGDKAFEGCTSLSQLDFPNLTTIEGAGFYGDSLLRKLETPNLTTVWGSAFTNCVSLQDVNMESVKELNKEYYYKGQGTFENCTSLKEIYLPSIEKIYGETSQNRGCFYNCNSLTKITIGKNCTLIGYRTFYGCKGLSTIICYSSIPPEIVDDTFEDDTYQNATLLIPSGAKKSYDSTTWSRFMNIKEYDATDIHEIIFDKNDDKEATYNLEGKRASRNTKGIIIKNGQKFLNK